jgi:hypothetical protein
MEEYKSGSGSHMNEGKATKQLEDVTKGDKPVNLVENMEENSNIHYEEKTNRWRDDKGRFVANPNEATKNSKKVVDNGSGVNIKSGVKEDKVEKVGNSGKVVKEGTSKKTKQLGLSDFTKEVLETKPMNSPTPEKWFKKGGSISIDENGTWTYTNKIGQSVSYPNGYPDFSPYAHPTVEPVTIKVAKPKNPQLDFKEANVKAGLSKNSDPPVPASNKPPEGYTWHHHEDGKTMILVDEDVHREFRHIGGQSTINGKNGKGE